ncbi:choice-of-anchor D domain-containing protein [Georgenia yuyongxinii]|uniref:Choice-of-anchor D domain-containing protein n=1 Tax=Georgenia yuyongxinii TaxID=2589797 RepID=A0A5B8C1I4_9MICO|nr:PA14 domain-containing protein [Georgenia yuyongxinii]QDC23910.1 choice-of-anchor D domain-containing protein [Georgenia yuyongxinii]
MSVSAPSRRRAGIASAAALAVVGAMALGATPAMSMPIATVPEDPAQWATSPYSPLPAGEIAAAGNHLELTFDGTEGGLHDGADVDTGFTMIQPSSANDDYYLPENLAVTGGNLTIKATKGIAYSNTGATGLINQQDNTLGVGVDANATSLELTTTVNSPAAATGSAQAGLWFGPDDQNYVKLALIGSDATGRQIQLSREINGLTANGAVGAPSADQIMVGLTQASIGTQPVHLRLVVNSVAGTLTGYYAIGAGAEQTLGTLALPTNYVDGTLLNPAIADVTSFAGIYATKRNMPEATALSYTFADFGLAELDSEPPAAPEGVTADAEAGQVSLAWNAAPVSSDVVGYRVYRASTSPVSTAGNGIGGTAALTTPAFTDAAVFVGQAYTYAVVAVDAAGNKSEPVEVQAQVPAIDGEPVALVNFQTAAATTPDGYTADTGAPYSPAAGSGWTSGATGAPLDLTTMTRLRAGSGVTPDPRLATIIHMQHTSTTVHGVWEYNLPNGTYTVVAAVGDTGSANGGGYDSTHAINAEGTAVISPFNPSSAREYDEGVATVEVIDGSLTIDAVGGSNTKLAYVGIYAAAQTPVAPAAPTGLTGAATAGGVQLEWTAVDGATGYDVFRSTEPAAPTGGAPLNAEPLTDAAFLDTTAEPGTTYYYAVVASNDGGTSPASGAVEVVVPADGMAPAAPGGVTGEATSTGVQLAWSAVDGAESYNVFRSAQATVPTDGTPVNAEPLTNANYLDTTAAAGQTYYYVVVAANAAGTSPASAAVEVTVPELPDVPAAPADMAGEATDDGVVLTWAASAGATSYEIYRGIGTQAQPEGQPHATVTAPTFTDSDVEPGTTYSYIVVALNDEGSSVPSVAVAVEVPIVDPSACTGSQWSAEYFLGTGLAGTPAAVECTDTVDQDWNQDGPADLRNYQFSARYTTVINGSGLYRFQAQADDGVRVIVDGETVIDQWVDQDGSQVHSAHVTLDAGSHTVVVEYYQAWGGAELSASFEKVDTTGECLPGQWSAQYYLGTELAGAPAESECVAGIDEDWSGQEGPAGIRNFQFSARYSTIVNDGAGVYTFSARADDGVRVIVDGTTVIDRWVDQDGKAAHTASLFLDEGAHDVVVEYYQAWGGAELHIGYDFTPGGSLCGAGQWAAEYFLGTGLGTQPAAQECVTGLDENWSQDGPAGLRNWQFSARYTTVVNEGAGTYRFEAQADDGVRVLVDGVPVIDQWVDQDGRDVHTGEVTLTDGSHTVVVEYYQGWGGAQLRVAYEKDGSDTEAPEAPTQLVATAGTTAIELSWSPTASTDAVGYHVYRGTEAGVTAGSTPLNTAPLTGTTYSDGTAAPGVTYYYVVTAVDTAGNESAVSNEATGLLTEEADTEAPAAPADLTATAGDGVVDLAWAASTSTDTVGYKVYRSLEPNVAITGELVSGEAPVTGTTYADTAVSNGTTYYYGVRAVDGAGNASLMSNEAFGVPRVPNDLDVMVDFAAAGTTPAAGYILDYGQAYGARTGANQGTGLTYGWVDEDGHALSLVGNGRDRGRAGIDERLDSILHMQYGDVDGTNGVDTEGTWEMAVPDGLYEVTIAVGDEGGTNGYDSVHVINAEAGVAIEGFQATAANEYLTATTTVGVWDGRLTLSPKGGTNTKIAYVEVTGLPMAPHVDTVLPDNRGTDHDVTAGVSATIRIPYAGVGVDPTTLQGNVRLFEAVTGTPVPVTVGTSGGNDVISLSPDESLDGNKTYRFVVTDAVKDNFGAAFVPFTSVFTTGSGEIIGEDEFTPLTGIEFEKVELPVAASKYWASFAFGPDGKLYGTTIGQGLFRMTVNEDGTLSNLENLGYQGRAMIGLVFDRDATAGNLRLWVTSTSANIGNETQEWISGISLLEGPNLQTERKVFTSLPRSLSDHLTNSIAYGPDGRLYFLQGSNQAAGDLDNSWGQRGEKLLTAAALVFDQDHPQVQAATTGNAPIDVKTADGGTYDPFAAGAPLKIHATGIRNAYDLVWHSNGNLYVPTNGTAGGANSPGVTANANGTFTRVAAPGIPGFATVNGRNVTDACLNHRIDGQPYTGGSVPAINNHPTQQDHLYRVEEHGYYGHPNPERCEWVLHEGNDPANPPTAAGQGGSKYPAGTKADSNYRGIAYNLGFNKSPNGALEYKSETFDGQLKGRLIVTRFSNNNDLIFLQADSATGKILGAQTSEGLTGVSNSTMTGVDGFNDPLEVVEDPNTGNLYVNQYNRGGSDQKLFLLRVPEEHQAPTLETSVEELVFSAVKSTTSAQKSVTVTNFSAETVTLGASLTGANAGEFALTGAGGPLAPGASATFQVQFKPGTTLGQRSAILRLTNADQTVDVGLYGLTMNGIEGGNEPTLHNVMGTLGYAINVGWTTLAGGMDPAAKGDEVLKPLFVKAGNGPVTMTPLAQYAPREDLPFGWYTGAGTTAERHQVGSIDINGYQSLLPPASPGSQTSFDPGTAEFGFYYFSNTFSRLGYTEDRLNSPASDAHRARIYPAKNRSGAPIANTYIVAFEDASNGDYQDYVFLVTGVKPAGEAPGPVEDAIKVNFSNEAAALPAGYLRDFGQPFGARTRSDQGTNLIYGWKDQATENPINLSVGGTTGPGNGRDRNTSQPDQRLDTLMHMQSADVTANGNTFNGVSAYAFWEIALPDGTYRVTVAAGDSTVNSDPEQHAINIENTQLIAPFAPTGAAGSNTRHKTAMTEVTLTDGFLTIDANGGTNTKINYVDIVPVDVDNDDPSDGAQVKVAFGPSSAPLTSGWVREAGSAYSDERGFGWVNAATGQPVDRTVATRYRTTPTAGVDYPTDNRLKSFAFLDNASQPSYTNGIWEYEVPNGTYRVAVSVGDAGFLDSTHGVAAEGQPVIASFVPTGTTAFQTGVRTVTVTDGKLSITNTGTNTKINWVSIAGDGLDPVDPPPTGEEAQIAFGPESAPLTAGWTREAGAAFSEARGFGWLDADTGQPVDRTVATRYRATAAGGIAYPSDDRLKSFAFMDSATQSYTNGTWEYALGNGTYTVEVSVGDAGFLDSTHGVAVEGVKLIDGFAPTGSAPFASATQTVEVTDGRLSLTNTGTNTKVNYIRITGEGLGAPAVGVTLNGVSVGASYSGGPVEVAINASVAGGTTLESLTYSVNGGPATAYVGPFNLGVGNHVLEVTAVDSDDRTTVREIALEILDVGGTAKLTNTQVTRQAGAPVPGLSEDWLVLHKINSGLGAHKFPSTGTVTLANTGTKDLRVTDVALTGSAASSFTLGTLPAAPFTLAPGQSVPVTVNFTSTTGGKGIRAAQVKIASSDAASPITTLEVRGGYMTSPEGGNELTLNQVSALYGWTTQIGNLVNGDEMRTSALKGDEVRSFQWKRMDSSKPVTARQLAAFHGCCGQTETINVNGATATHHGDYGQSIYPLNNAQSGPTQLTTNPTGNFNLTVSGQNTANPNYMAVKTWPVIDKDGKVVAGSWIVGHDYISSPNQCGIGATNCDFQDNVYLVTNILPVTPHDATAPAAPSGVEAEVAGQTVVLGWDASTEADVAGYHVERSLSASGPWTRLTGGTPLTGTTFTDSAVPAAGTGFYRVLAVDLSGTVSTAATPVEVDLPEVDEAPIRINAGGGAVTLGGVQWSADQYFSGGKSYSNPQVTQIAGTTDDVLYQSERSATSNLGSFGYDIPVNGGGYVVRLHFAEIYHGATGGGAGGTGKRVFSANLEGGPTEITNLDLNAVVPPMTAHVIDVPVTVTDGNLDIDLTATVNQPKISAIEVLPVR